MDALYLVDNNVLNTLRRDQIQSDLFRQHCRVTEDVMWEAREHPERKTFEEILIPFSPGYLDHVRVVMAMMEVGDNRLVDLYKNKGAADPGLIALIIEATAIDDETLFSNTWVLVTNDQAVAQKANDFGLTVIRPSELAKLIDESPL